MGKIYKIATRYNVKYVLASSYISAIEKFEAILKIDNVPKGEIKNVELFIEDVIL